MLLGRSWGVLGLLLGALGRSWASLGHLLAALEALSGALEALLGRSWAALRRSCGSWDAFGCILALLGALSRMLLGCMHKNAQHTADESMTLVALSVSPLGQVQPRKGSLGGPLDSLLGLFGQSWALLGLSW